MKDFKIKNIRELRWEYCDVLYLEEMEFDIEKFVLDLNFNFNINKDEEIIGFFFHTKYGLRLKEDKTVQILHSDIEIEFYIQDFEENFSHQEVDTQKLILTMLLDITMSTSRGIIYANTKGHMVNQLILPIVNTKILLDKKLEKDKIKEAKEN